MTQVSLLIDNDVVIKLAQMDAYADAMSALGIKTREIGSLATMLRYMGRTSPDRRAALTRTPEEANRLGDVLPTLVEIEPTPEESRLAAAMMKVILLNELDMQEGEVTLMAVAIERPGTNVATGDKRALRALPALASLFTNLATLKGRFICFEQIFQKICQQYGMPRVRAAVLRAWHADATLAMTYDYFKDRGPKHFIGGLTLVIKEQVSTPAPDWLMSL